MATQDEIQRVAAAMHAVRPDWNPRSIATYLERNHASRAYRDLLIAGVCVAADTRTQTPKLLEQHGAWWVAAQAASGERAEPLRFPRCPEPGHTSYPAHNCGACRAEQLGVERTNQEPRTPTVPPERVRQILAGEKETT